MAQFETWLKSDLNSPPIIQTIKGNVFSSDNQGNLVGVEVYHDGEPVALVGTVSGYIIRDDGATVIVSGTVDGNKASIIMPEAAYVCPGPIGIAIRLTNGTSRVVLGACRGIVYRTSTEHIVDPSHEIPDIDELLAQLVAIRAATSAANTATANANAAAGNATTAAGNANEKATLANAAAGTANAAAAKIDGMTVAASLLPTGSAPTATITEVSGHKHIAFGIPKGDKGKDFHIAHTFASIAAMEAYSGPLELFDYAMIDTGSVQDADTGKLYCYEADEQWHYIGDLSGAQGIKGETGETGPQGIQGPKGEQGDPASVEQIQSAVNNYLAGVITNPDSPPLDRSLASPSAAAPADMVGDLRSAINGNGIYSFTRGYRVYCNSSTTELSPTSNANSGYIITNVKPGERYRIHGYTNSNYYAWAIFEDGETAGTVARVSASESGEVNEIVSIPTNGKYLVVNTDYREVDEPICYRMDYPLQSEFDAEINFIKKGEISTFTVTDQGTYSSIPLKKGYIYSFIATNISSGSLFNIYTRESSSGSNIEFIANASDLLIGEVVFKPNHDTSFLRVVKYSDSISFTLNIKCLNSLIPLTEKVLSYGNNNGVHIRVGTYNTGDFDGATGTDALALAMRLAIAKANVDVWGFQLDRNYFNDNDSVLAKDAIFSELEFYNQAGSSWYNYKSLAGYYKITSVEQITYQGPFAYAPKHPYFLVGNMNINGYTIKVASIHLDWEDKYTRRQEIAEIVSYLSNYDYSIVLGDINPDNCVEGTAIDDNHMLMLQEELPIWEAAGFKHANVGRFGIFNTYVNGVDSRHYPCDNIFISGNMFFKQVGIIQESYMNDHCILWADIAFS